VIKIFWFKINQRTIFVADYKTPEERWTHSPISWQLQHI